MQRILAFSVLAISFFACAGSKPKSLAPVPAAENQPRSSPGEDKQASVVDAEEKTSAIATLAGLSSPFTATFRIDATAGGIDEARSTELLLASATKLEACAYESDFESHWSIGLVLNIDVSGKAKIEIEGAKAPLVSCLEKVASALEFPQATAATRIDAAIMVQHSQSGPKHRPATGRFAMQADVEDGAKSGQPVTQGSLSKNVIQRVIRSKLPRIRYCYEKQLIVQPNLKGKVVAKFLIAPTGAVSQVSATGMNTTVSHCIKKTIQSIQFPTPAGGGYINVSYPFTFSPAP
ncbi:MAG: AgmX/PglI C-terminal domain-containing protein [Kofleriaceae bacterium]|nr:AgmX/PglI C-terminal domain-containing protein [Kofleriaceae bacterium]